MDLLQPKRFFRPDEVAAVLALSRRTIYRMIRDGRLPGVKWGPAPGASPGRAWLVYFPRTRIPGWPIINGPARGYRRQGGAGPHPS